MDATGDPAARAERLLDRVHAVARARHLSPCTEEAYRAWIVRFVRFSDLRHPAALGVADVRQCHRDVSTTMIYLHVLDKGVGVRSPLDLPVGVLGVGRGGA